MSFKLVKKVISSDLVDGTHKLILIILADYVNETNGNAAWPSVTTVAIKAGTSIRHTRRIIRELEAQGVLKTVRQAGLKGTNKYVIDLSGADTHVLPRADIYDTKGGHLRHVGADTHVLRIDKEHIRTDTLDRAAPSGRAAAVSLEKSTEENVAVVRAVAHDAPKCTEHTEYQFRCITCYDWQQAEWRKEPIT
jgi:predicted ThiF/HesA family dinucleotide-utilizing enzyme